MRAWWSSPSEGDMRCIAAQLQREPRQVIAVARRCRFGFPQVIVTSPIVWGPGRRSEKRAEVAYDDPRVFPTLFWLSCPYLTSAVGRLEGQGWVGRLKLWLERSDLQEVWRDVHRRAACERLLVLAEGQECLLREAHPAQWQVLTTSGVGGARSVAGIKCLHAHLADYLAGPVGDERPYAATDALGSRNPVGAKTLALLLQNGVDVSGCAECVCGEPPAARRLVAMDVGSNSCRLLAVDVDDEGHQHRPAAAMESTRLAEGLQQRGTLATDALARTLQALGTLRDRGLQGLASPSVQVMAVATSAMREASNPEALLLPAWEQLGLALRVISGEEEAQLSFRGALAGWRGERSLLTAIGVLDIGGGSTELVVGTPESGVTWSASVKMGAVRLKDVAFSAHIGEKDVEALTAIAKESLQEELSAAQALLPDGEAVLLGVGGTLTSLAAIDLGLRVYDPERIQGHQLTRRRIAEIATKLAAWPLAQRRQVPGLQPERADIIVTGAAIALAAMDILQQEQIVINEADILQGMIESFQVRSVAP